MNSPDTDFLAAVRLATSWVREDELIKQGDAAPMGGIRFDAVLIVARALLSLAAEPSPQPAPAGMPEEPYVFDEGAAGKYVMKDDHDALRTWAESRIAELERERNEYFDHCQHLVRERDAAESAALAAAKEG